MPDQFPTIKLAAVQAAPVFLDRDATVKKACDFIREAGANGADIIGFPENYISGYPGWYYYHPANTPKSMKFARELFKSSVEIPSKATQELCKAAREAQVYVVMGLNERMPNTTGTVYNTNLFINKQGQIVGKHQKLVPTISERLVHANGSGATLRTFPSEFGPISSLICGENANPFAVAVMASEYPVVHVANWPTNFVPRYVPMPDSTLMVSRSIAYSLKSFVISSCGVNSPELQELLPLTDDDREILADPTITGGSAIIAPGGVVLAGPWTGHEEGILYAEADLEKCVHGRLIHDYAGHYNRPDVFRLTVNDTPTSLVHRTAAAKMAVEHEAFMPVESIDCETPLDEFTTLNPVEVERKN